MDPDEHDRLNRVVDHEVKGHFPPGAVRRAVLLRHGDEPGIGPGQLRLRVFVPPQDAADEQALEAWRNTHRADVDELRRDISRRLPSARLLEFTFDDLLYLVDRKRLGKMLAGVALDHRNVISDCAIIGH